MSNLNYSNLLVDSQFLYSQKQHNWFDQAFAYSAIFFHIHPSHIRSQTSLSAISQCESRILPRDTSNIDALSCAHCTRSLFHLSLGFCLMISKSFCETLEVVLYAFHCNEAKEFPHNKQHPLQFSQQYIRCTLKVAYDWNALCEISSRNDASNHHYKGHKKLRWIFVSIVKATAALHHTFYSFTASSTWVNDTFYRMKTAQQTLELCK